MQQISAAEAPVKTRAMQLMERRLGQPLESFLRQRYVDERRTTQEIADELGIVNGTVSRWMAALGIEARLVGPRKSVA